jgi:hypothetical protein
MAWLLFIALTLLFSVNYLDVASCDIITAIGAFSLVKLSQRNVVKNNFESQKSKKTAFFKYG